LVISVAMCTFNGEQFLEEQLSSLELQTDIPNELVVVDDDSTDSTADIVQKFSRNSSFPVFFTKNSVRLGIAKNFELAASKCSGELIFFSDQDDIWLPEKIKTISKVFQDSPLIQLIHTNARLVDQNRATTGETLFDVINLPKKMLELNSAGCTTAAFSELLKRNLVTGATLAVRAEFLKQALPIGENWLHDEWLGILAAFEGSLACLDEVLIDYRQHGNNAVGAYGKSVADYLNIAARSQAASYTSSTKKVTALLDHLNARPESAESVLLRALEKKLKFTVRREKYSRWRFFRTIPILEQIVRANYRLYSPGLRSAILDQFARR
jgi:glycosyltransferase involved in cell wall biosynthesis